MNMVRGRTEPVEEHDVENSGRLIFMDKAVVSTSPTSDGNAAIDSFHQFAGIKWLREKPLKKFEDAQWLLIQKAEEEKLLQVTINLPQKVMDQLIDDCNGRYLSIGVSKYAQLWNEQRSLILKDALFGFLLPSMKKEAMSLPTSRAKNRLLWEYGKVFWNKVSVGPYQRKESDISINCLKNTVERMQVARDITRECAGLPLGIKTIAGTMKGVDGMHEWRYVLEHLKQSKVPQDKMEEEVFQILRFSYTHLSDKALQQCFLYCGLYPEDYEIHRENLIDYLIDEGVVKRQKSREVEINEGHTMLDRLERACLLERLHGRQFVMMHR